MNKKKISFFQALLIAIGFMIGSGIFFKADDMLMATGGNALLVIIGWITLGTTLVFAGIAISYLAAQTDTPGGISAYTSQVWGKKIGYFAGVFMSTIYAPIMICVIASVLVTYLISLLGLSEQITSQELSYWLITAFIILIIFFYNILSTTIAARVSSVSTMIKVIPLIVIAFVGLLTGQSNNITMFGMSGADSLSSGNVQVATGPTWALFAGGMISMAFAFDGWISVGVLSIEMKNPKKDLSRVFSIATLITTIIYIAYFTGVAMLEDPMIIIASGDEHVINIANGIFGTLGGTLMIIGVVISVLGTLNANVMAGIRYPYAVATTEKFPFGKFVSQINQKTNTPIYGSAYLFFMTTIIFIILAVQKMTVETSQFLSGVNLEDLAVFFTSIFYVIIFIGVIKLGRKQNGSYFKTIISPIIALIGQTFVVISFFLVNDSAMLYIIITVSIISFVYIFKGIGEQSYK